MNIENSHETLFNNQEAINNLLDKAEVEQIHEVLNDMFSEYILHENFAGASYSSKSGVVNVYNELNQFFNQIKRIK